MTCFPDNYECEGQLDFDSLDRARYHILIIYHDRMGRLNKAVECAVPTLDTAKSICKGRPGYMIHDLLEDYYMYPFNSSSGKVVALLL